MVLESWTLLDCDTGLYEPPMFFRSDMVAQTYFQRTIAKAIEKGEIVSNVMSNYSFCKVGQFDDELGRYIEDFHDFKVLKIDGEGALEYV